MKIESKIAKLVAVGILAAAIMGCNSPTITYKGDVYCDYGLLNQDQNQDPSIEYKPDWWNIVVAIIFFETILAPIYVFGFHCMKPVGPKRVIKQ